MTPEEIQRMIDEKVAQAMPRMLVELGANMRQIVNPLGSVIKENFDANYYLMNATNSRSASPPPRGSILMVDAGTTPSRVIALYLSTGSTLVEIFAKVI